MIFFNNNLKGTSINKAIKTFTQKSPPAKETQGKPVLLKAMKKNNIVSTREPKSEDANGAMYHFLFLSLSKT